MLYRGKLWKGENFHEFGNCVATCESFLHEVLGGASNSCLFCYNRYYGVTVFVFIGSSAVPARRPLP